MPGKFRTFVTVECEVSKTSAELKSETQVVLKAFDGEVMTKQELDAAIEMLREVSSRMRKSDEEPEED